ncbi:hypothetical protein ACN6K6_006472 [Streptomyces violaceoruber]|uniref:Nuclear transport factor 2 family protein n=1 Tax=Streptomyces anthocyanicus TaxID=68174 RepID=A0ABZ1LVL0_9ACTN|nr:hypothetical protein [Streptomyces sp. ME02-6979A]MDX3344789.1 hypothetical protein [Streptomyces sp. ME02-6979A]
MTTAEVPSAVRAFVDAIDRGDSEAFTAAFTGKPASTTGARSSAVGTGTGSMTFRLRDGLLAALSTTP